MKKQLLLRFFSATMLVCGFLVASGQSYTYAFTPTIGTYTNCGSGTDDYDAISYYSCSELGYFETYSLGHIRTTVWNFNQSTGLLTIRVRKCSGYFSNGNSFKIIVKDNWNLEYHCFPFTINNSTSDYVQFTMSIPWTNFNGIRSLSVFLITSDLVYRQYGGTITVSCSSSGNADICYCAANTTLTAPSGSFDDGSDDNDYGNNSDCKWLIQPPGATSISLNFTNFSTEENYDFVDIYDGNSTNSPLLESYSGSFSPASVTSSGGSMLVHFHSDGSVRSTGWIAHYTSSTTSGCYCDAHTTLTAPFGTFTDGSGSNEYANNSDCEWLIMPTGATSITLDFLDFDTESSWDYVKIYDGPSTSSPLLATYSGPNLNPASVTSTGGTMLVQFHTDQSVTEDGWTAHYTSSTSPVGCTWSDCTSGSCGSTQYLSASQKMEAAQYLCQHNIIDNGTGGQPLRPDDYITRAELAKIAFYGLYDGSPNVPNTLVTDYIPSPYTDLQVATTFYYRAAKALLYLQYHDDATGTTPFDRDRAYFNPNGTISRSLMLKVLMETFNIEPYNGTSTYSPFTDYNATDNFWRYARKAYNLGITNASQFRPYDNCTRAEAFVFLYRILTSSNIQISTPNNSSDPYTSDFFIPNNLSPAALSAIGGIEYGNYEYYSKNCFSYPGWVNMDFGFTYNSYLTEMPEDYYPLTPLGHRAWSHTYNQYLNIIYDPFSGHDFLLFHLAEGNILMFENTGTNIKKLTEGNYDTLETNGSNIYTLTTPSQVTYTFEKLVSSKPIYYLTSIQNRFGDGIDINYQPSEATGYRRIANVISGSGISSSERSLVFSYSAGSDNISSVTDTKNRTVHFYYSNDKLYQFTDAMNHHTKYNYGTLDMEKDLLKDVVMPSGDTVHNNYERRKLRSTQTNSNTATTITQSVTQSNNAVTYNSNVTEHVQGNQYLTTHYFMNDLGKVTHVYDNCNVDMTFNYTDADHKALPSSIADNKTGITSAYVYSHKGLIKQRTTTASGVSQTESWEYNNRNDISQYTDANNHTTHYFYDNSGALEEIRDPLNHVTSITNNAHGQPYRVQSPTGITYQYLYTPRGLLRDMSILGTGISQSYTYDIVGRMITTTDYNGNTTQYSYDDNDNITEITDALNHTTTLIYDVNDNLINIINALGHSTTLTYNEDDLCTSQSFGGHTRYFTYNSDGSLHTIVSPSGQTRTFSYNNSGDVTNDGYATYNFQNNSLLGSVSKDNKAISYNYDALGRVTSVAYDGKTVGYTYDNAGNILTIVYPGNKTVTYTYDAANRMTSVKDWNNHTTSYHYRDDNQLDYVQYPNYVRTTYSYDNAGRRLGQATKRNSGNGSIIAQYSYDLDDNGNHEYENIIEPYTTLPNMTNQSLTYHYGADNRLQYFGNTSFNYDNNGNTVSKTGRTLNYDICDNLTSVSGNFNATYTYDGLGNRRSATRNGVTTKYVLDILQENDNVLMETNNSGTALNYYIYGADGLVSRIGADGTTTHYYIADHRGSIVAMVNSTSSATVTHRYQYDEFGSVLQSEEADNNPFRYVGKYGLMYETGDLYFVRARYYDPEIGRFLSEDPIWATNLYPYANNNPITNVDINGAQPIIIALWTTSVINLPSILKAQAQSLPYYAKGIKAWKNGDIAARNEYIHLGTTINTEVWDNYTFDMATAVTITSGEPELMVLGKILDYAGTIYTATVKNNPNDLWAGAREASIAVAEKALASKATKVLSTPTRNSKGQFLKGFNWITERRTTIKSQIGENILKSVFNKLLRSF